MLLTPALWEQAMDSVRAHVGAEAFDAWIAPTHPEDYDEESGALLLVAPNDFYRRWIERRYKTELELAFSEAAGRSVRVSITTEEDIDVVAAQPAAETGAAFDVRRPAGPEPLPEATRPRFEPAGDNGDNGSSRAGAFSVTDVSDFTTARREAPATQRRRTPSDSAIAIQPRLNPRYLFDEYVVGESNRYAHAAALAVADPKSKAFNPLFIYGGSGLGKTHLMHAIGHKMFEMDRRLKVLYVTSEHFINGFIDAIQNKRHIEFREAYRNVDLLLIDDVQFLTGKERTQQEFFHTFNALYDAGKKVVVTSDRPPRELSTLEERLRSRFEWGLLVDIQSPDLETRIAILRNKARHEGVQLSNDVILFIAEHITENIREMEGALKRLRMAASLHNRRIDLETAREVLGHLLVGTPQPRVSVEDVQRAVCTYFGINLKDLLGKNRSKKFSQPRHIAQYLSRKMTDFSFPDIAQKFGGKDHTSVIYACRKVEQASKKDSAMASSLEYLTRQITRGGEQ